MQAAQGAQRGVAVGFAGEAARQHMIGVVVGHHEGAQHDGGRHQRLPVPLGRERRRHGILRDILAGLGTDVLDQRLSLLRLEHAHDDGLAVLAEAGTHDHEVEVGQGEAEGRRLTQPPHIERRQLELLAQQVFAQPLEKRHDGRRLDDTRPQRIGECDIAAARRLHQAGDAKRRIGAHLQRIGEGAVEAPQQHVHGPEAGQGLDRHLAVTGHHVTAFHERKPQYAREIDVLEIGGRQQAWRQQCHVGLCHGGRRHRAQRLVPTVDEGSQMTDGNGAECLRQAARQNTTHLEGVADARGKLGMVGQYMPAPVAQSHQIDRIVAEMALRRGAIRDPGGAQEMPVGVDQHRRQQLLLQQRLRAVDIGQDLVEKARALDKAFLDTGPFVGRDDHRQRVEGPSCRAAIVQQVDGRTRLLELPASTLHAFTCQ